MILALFVASLLGNIIEKHSLMFTTFLLFSIKDIKQQSTTVARIMGKNNFLYKNTKALLDFREHFQGKLVSFSKTKKLQGYCQLLALP